MDAQNIRIGDYVHNRNSGSVGKVVALPYNKSFDWLTVQIITRSGKKSIRKWALKNLLNVDKA